MVSDDRSVENEARVPANVPWGVLEGLFLVALFFATQIWLGSLLVPTNLAAQVVVFIVSGFLVLVATGFVIGRYTDGPAHRVLGLVNPGLTGWLRGWKAAAAGVLIYLAVATGWFELLKWLGAVPEQLPRQPLVEMIAQTDSTAAIVVTVLAAVVVAPAVEEVVFRSVLYLPLRRSAGPFAAALIVSLVFALLHNYAWGIPQLMVLSMIFVALFETTGTLWAAIAAHALYNGAEITVVLWS